MKRRFSSVSFLGTFMLFSSVSLRTLGHDGCAVAPEQIRRIEKTVQVIPNSTPVVAQAAPKKASAVAAQTASKTVAAPVIKKQAAAVPQAVAPKTASIITAPQISTQKTAAVAQNAPAVPAVQKPAQGAATAAPVLPVAAQKTAASLQTAVDTTKPVVRAAAKPAAPKLSKQEQKKSDMAVLQALTSAASQAFIVEKDEKIADGEKAFESAFDAYLCLVEQEFKTCLAAQFGCKKTDAIKAVVGSNPEKSLLAYARKHWKVSAENDMHLLYDTLGSHVAQARKLLQPCFFDASLLKTVDAQLQTLVVNTMVANRVHDAVPTATNQAISDDFIAQKIAQMQAAKEPFTLEKLALEMNRARLHPDFLRAAYLLGSKAEERCVRGSNPVQCAYAQPMLKRIVLDNEVMASNSLVYGMLADQLFFDKDALDQVADVQSSTLTALVDGHIARVAKSGAKVAVSSLIATVLDADFTLAELTRSMQRIKTVARTKEDSARIEQLIKDLQVFDVQADQVVTSLKSAADKRVLMCEARVRKAVQEVRKERHAALTVVRLLEQAKTEYDKTGNYMASTLVSSLKEHFGAHVTDRYLQGNDNKGLTGLLRTPQSFKAQIAALAKPHSQVVDAYDSYFEKWLEPYSSLVAAIDKEWLHDSSGCTLAKLSDLLTEFNAGRREHGAYEGMLSAMINAVHAYDVPTVQREFDYMIARARVLGEPKTRKEYRAWRERVSTTLINQVAQASLQELGALNEGRINKELALKDLPLVGPQKGHNARVYKALTGSFDAVASLLTQGVVKASEDAVAKALEVTRKTVTTKLTTAQLADGVPSITSYLQRLQERIALLRQASSPQELMLNEMAPGALMSANELRVMLQQGSTSMTASRKRAGRKAVSA